MNGTEKKREVQTISMKEEKRPLFKMIDGKKVKVCAHHRIDGDILIMYDEQGEEIGREYSDGRPVPATKINKEKRKTIWTPSRGQVEHRFNETTGEWEEV